MSKRVAVIGAGVSGLTSVKSCLEDGMEPVCFEQRKQIGGMWSGVDELLEGCAPQPYKSLITNSSKGMTCFSDFPFPKEVPTYMTSQIMREYLNSYAEHFNLNKYINLGSKIHKISKTQDFDETGKWEIDIEDRNGRRYKDVFHGVIVCTGICVKPKYPVIEGMDKFEGKLEHSMHFKAGEDYKDKKVVVIGNSFSAGDIAVAVCEHTKQIHLSVGNGCKVLRRFDLNGRPTDMQLLKRVYKSSWMNSRYEEIKSKISDITLNHEIAGILPKKPSEAIMLNDEITLKIMSGKVKIVEGVVRLGEGKKVQLEGGRILEDVDVVIFATGYSRNFPFLDKSITNPPDETDGEKVNWYKMVFPVDLKHHTLAMVGFVSSDGSHVPLYELQSRLAARVLSGNHQLPSKEIMMADVNKWNAIQKEKYSYYKYQVPYVLFRDEIAEEIGVKPNFWELLWTNPRLALLCQFGTAFPVQFRLVGPHKLENAAKLCFEAHANTFAGIQHRQVTPQSSGMTIPKYMNIAVVALTMGMFLYLSC